MRDLLSRPGWQSPAVALLLVATAVVVTWPVVLDLNGSIFGSQGDLTGSIANLRELLQEGLNPFTPGTLSDFDAPAGTPVNWVINWSTLPNTGLLFVLGWLFGATAAYTLFAFLGFLLSGMAMWWFLRYRLGLHGGASVVGAWAFAFYPFAVINAQGHNDFVHGWPFVLIFAAALRVRERPTARTGLVLGGALLLAMWWSPYYLLMAGAVWSTTVVVLVAETMVRRKARVPMLGAVAVSAVPALVFSGAIVLLLVLAGAGAGQGIRTHEIRELFTYGGRWFEFVVPPPVQTLFGSSTAEFYAARDHGSGTIENTLYLGLGCLALATVGFVDALWRKRRRSVAALSVALAVAGVYWAAPPVVSAFGVSVPTPSRVVFELTSTFRVYSRFVIVVIPWVIVLAAFGVHAVARRLPGPAALAWVLVAGAVIAADFWVAPATEVTKLSEPRELRELARFPDGRVLQYPLGFSGSGNYGPLFYQQVHGKPVANGFKPGTPREAALLAVARLDDPSVPFRLRALGIRYVVLSAEPPPPGVTAPGEPVPGLRLRARGPYARVYEVMPQAARPTLEWGAGADPEEAWAEGPVRWISAATAQGRARAQCASCRSAEVRFVAASYEQPRSLTVLDGRGRVVLRTTVSQTARPVRFRVPIEAPADGRFVVRVSPGPAISGGGAPRSLALKFTEVRVRGLRR